jgi:hypothetical protein
VKIKHFEDAISQLLALPAFAKKQSGQEIPDRTNFTAILLNLNSLLTIMAKTIKKRSSAKPKKIERFYPAEEQGILKDKTKDEKRLDMDLGEDDEDIYSEEGRDKLTEDSEIDPWEEGFMEGASQAGQLGKDALTGEPLMDADDVVEMELDSKLYRFTSRKNAELFRKKKEKEKKK